MYLALKQQEQQEQQIDLLRAFKAYLKFILSTTSEILHCISKIFSIILRLKAISLERENKPFLGV